MERMQWPAGGDNVKHESSPVQPDEAVGNLAGMPDEEKTTMPNLDFADGLSRRFQESVDTQKGIGINSINLQEYSAFIGRLFDGTGERKSLDEVLVDLSDSPTRMYAMSEFVEYELVCDAAEEAKRLGIDLPMARAYMTNNGSKWASQHHDYGRLAIEQLKSHAHESRLAA